MFLDDSIKKIELSNSELILMFKELLEFNNYKVIDVIKEYKFNNFISLKEGITYSFYVNIKTIKDAYLAKYPNLLRRQISFLDGNLLVKNNENSFSLIVGLSKVDDKFIFVIWDAFDFINHKKNRSCYITNTDLIKMKKLNYLKTKYNFTKSYVIDLYGFNYFISDFLKDNVA